MTTLALQQTRVRERAVVKDGFEAPAYALRQMPSISNLPKDALGRDIAILLVENPDIRAQIGEVNLGSLSVADKVALLDRIKSALGIRPIRNRRVGYVGP